MYNYINVITAYNYTVLSHILYPIHIIVFYSICSINVSLFNVFYLNQSISNALKADKYS